MTLTGNPSAMAFVMACCTSAKLLLLQAVIRASTAASGTAPETSRMVCDSTVSPCHHATQLSSAGFATKITPNNLTALTVVTLLLTMPTSPHHTCIGMLLTSVSTRYANTSHACIAPFKVVMVGMRLKVCSLLYATCVSLDVCKAYNVKKVQDDMHG